MSTAEAVLLAWLLGAVQVSSLTSALFVRVSSGRPSQPLAQRIFVSCLALMGVVTMGALYLGPGYWLMAAATLASMILIVTCDFGEERSSAPHRFRR